jgi:hypothetical protein
VKPSVRKILADSHIAAVAMAVLLTFALEWALDALWSPFIRVADFVFNSIAILDVSSGSLHFDFTDRATLFVSFFLLCSAATAVASAWILSRWAYGETPLSTLRGYYARIARHGDV